MDEFEFGMDILDLKTGDYKEPVLGSGLLTKAEYGNSKNIYLLSEQGYMALVSLMKTDKAKELRKRFRRESKINEIQVLGTQEFMGKQVPVIEGGFGIGQKVVLAKTVAEIHGVNLKRINELINDNIDEFEEGIDILDLKNSVDTADPLLELGFTKQSIANSKNIYLLSEQGYMALVSLMKTDKAKELRKRFRRESKINEIQVLGTQEFMGKQVPVIEGGFGIGQKVVLAKTVAEIHEQRLDKVNELINNNIDEFEEGIDFLDLKVTLGKGTILKS